jgi:hypothetical protein
MKYILAILTISFYFFSCANNSEHGNYDDSASGSAKATSSVTPTPTQPQEDSTERDNTRVAGDGKVPPQTDDTARLMVSFISKGFGIDTKSKNHFDVWLSARNESYTANPWGREGEVSYCFPLKNKSAAEQEAFIRDVKNELTNRDLIVFNENIPCERRR